MKHNHALFMDLALRVAQESYGVRDKVGAILARDGNILAYGYNGTPEGWDNCCETTEVEYFNNPEQAEQYLLSGLGWSLGKNPGTVERLVTKPEVVHAEMNILKKMANSSQVVRGASLYCTRSPCQNCATAFIGMGLKEVFYKYEYRSLAGISLFQKDGVNVFNWDEFCACGLENK